MFGWGGVCSSMRGMSGAAAVALDGGLQVQGRIIGILCKGGMGRWDDNAREPTIIEHEQFLSSKAILDELRAVYADDNSSEKDKTVTGEILELQRHVSY
jgi:hypothetical protein